MHRFRQGRHFAYVFAVISVAVMGAAWGPEPLRVEPQSLERRDARADQETPSRPIRLFPLRQPLLDCAGLRRRSRRDLEGLPVVRLHGDAHVEQFAFTNDAWGLDDFDDSARGPALSISCGSSARSISWLVSVPGKRIVTGCSIDLSKAISAVSPSPLICPVRPTSCAGYAPRRHRHARRFSRGARARCNRWPMRQ